MKRRTREENAARRRQQREAVFDLQDADLIPKNADGEDFSVTSLRRFRRRRDRCRRSLADFAVTYCMGDGGFLETPPTGRLLDILAQMQRAVVGEGRTPTPFHIRMSRGHGKTSFVKCAIAYALAYGFRRYVVAVSAGTDGASGIIDEIWGLFEQSETLYQDFPELCVPVRLAQGNSNRAKRVAFHGRRTAMRKSAKEIRLPVMDGFEASGAILAARSFLAGTRGLVRNTLRPDLVLFDDVQTDEMADSAMQILAAERKIDGAFMGLAGHRKKIAALMTSTPIRPFDLSEVYAEKASWLTFTFPMFARWPSCWKSDAHEDLWGEYFKRKDRDVVGGGDEAGAFYRANRKAMDEGAEVLNPDNFDAAAGEASAVQHAMNLYYTNGAEAFAAEYQMQPIRSSAVYELTPALVRSRLSGLPSFVTPAGVYGVFAAVDVMNEAGLRWALTAFGPGNVAAVVAYGRHPASGRPLYPHTAPQDQQDSAIAAALQALLDQFAAARVVDETGAARRIVGVGIDAGWRMRTVLGVCAHERGRRRFDCVESMRGVPWDKFNPVTEAGSERAGVRLADEWAYYQRNGSLAFHSDFWAETAQRAWFNEPRQPGSVTVFGTDAAVHKVFADEVCADRLAEKDRTRAGRTTWRWVSHGPNHLGDCVKMAFALAYWRRYYSTAPVIAEPERPQPAAPASPRQKVAFTQTRSVRFA